MVYVSVPLTSVLDPSAIGPPGPVSVTVPVGVPAPGDTADTVIVKVADCPTTLGLGDELIVVVVAAWVTFSCRVVVAVALLKLASPS